MEVGKDFNKILFEEILTGISKAVNQINDSMTKMDEILAEEDMNYFIGIMRNTITAHIDGQVESAKKTRDAFAEGQKDWNSKNGIPEIKRQIPLE